MKTETKAKRAKAPAKRVATKPVAPKVEKDALIRLMLSEISSGSSMREVCSKHGVALTTFFDWVSSEEWAEHYARAREARADIKFEELEDVSEQAVMAGNAVEVAGLRLKADNIKWMLGKMAPKRYGDKTQTEVTGAVNLTLFDGEQARRMAEQLTRDSSRA